MKKQTAVEWLVEQVFNDIDLKDSILKLAISQAKELEKMQIIEAYEQGETAEWTPFEFKTAQDYYISTYGQ
jgi:hypothetical protein